MKTSNKIMLAAGCVPLILILVILIGTRIEMKYYTDNDFSFSYELYGLQRARDIKMITEEEYDVQKKDIMEDESRDIEETDLQKAMDMGLITEEEYVSLKNRY